MPLFDKLYITLPILKEFENLEKIIDLIFSQSYGNIELVVCINQPESWWVKEETMAYCLDNQKSLIFCNGLKNLPVTIIDKSSKGMGWDDRKKGVGHARKIMFDYIASKAKDTDLIISLDADVLFSINYFQSIRKQFISFPNSVGMAVPYYHPMEENEIINRAILRYEIYMRYYLLNLLRIRSPYAFTALGSSMVFPVWAYKKVNGITALEAGEDFYFIQKLCKTGKLLLWNSEKTFPSARISDRVPFGTGPAIKKGVGNCWDSYPFYSHLLFDEVEKTYKIFPQLFAQEQETPLTPFLKKQLRASEIWAPLRKNFKTEKAFIRACHERLDALRIFQFLKQNHDYGKPDEQHLIKFVTDFYDDMNIDNLSFQESKIEELDLLRSYFEKVELELRYKYDYENFILNK